MKDINISPDGELLVYQAGYTANEVQAILEKHCLKGIRISHQLKDEKLEDLNFLKDFSFLEVLRISTVDDHDFGFLEWLPNLRELSIATEGKNPIDLSRQCNLEYLALTWRKGKITGLEHCRKIKTLCLIDFFEQDLLPLSSLSALRELMIKTSTIKTLNEIDHLTQLNSLSLGNCRRLENINAITALKELTDLDFQICSKIFDFTAIGQLTELRALAINNSKNVKSLDFLAGLKKLNSLSLLENTNVMDGDLIPAREIKDVYYRPRAHYNIKIENPEHKERIKRNLAKIASLFHSSG